MTGSEKPAAQQREPRRADGRSEERKGGAESGHTMRKAEQGTQNDPTRPGHTEPGGTRQRRKGNGTGRREPRKRGPKERPPHRRRTGSAKGHEAKKRQARTIGKNKKRQNTEQSEARKKSPHGNDTHQGRGAGRRTRRQSPPLLA